MYRKVANYVSHTNALFRFSEIMIFASTLKSCRAVQQTGKVNVLYELIQANDVKNYVWELLTAFSESTTFKVL